MTRRIILLLAFLVAMPLVAQATREVARIEVRGNVPTDIVISQSAVKEGRTYSDRDLEIATARLRRLPFVYDARYSMDGSTLVFEVNAMSPFFGEVNASGSRFHQDERGTALLGAGGRRFLGSHGVARAQVGANVFNSDSAAVIDAEYAHYGLAGTRLFAIAGISQSFHRDDNFEADPALRLTVGYPLTIRQTVSASLTTAGFSSERRIPILLPQTLVSSSDQRALTLRWNYDTTDDPFFARRGELINVAPTWIDEDSRFHGLSIHPPDRVDIITTRSDGTSTNFAFDATKLWSIGSRGAIVSGVSASIEERDFLSQVNDALPIRGSAEERLGTISLGYAHNLFDMDAPLTRSRHRLELGVAAHRREIDQGRTDLTLDQYSLTAGYVFRRQFATVRLSLSYTMD